MIQIHRSAIECYRNIEVLLKAKCFIMLKIHRTDIDRYRVVLKSDTEKCYAIECNSEMKKSVIEKCY